jgi:hypothetical protein
VAAPSSELHLPAWLRARGGGTLIFGAVGVLAVLFVGYTVWDRLSSSVADPAPAGLDGFAVLQLRPDFGAGA